MISTKTLGTVLAVALAGLAVVGIASSATRTDPAKQVAAVEAYGFTNVEMKGWAWFACSEDDDLKYAFTARDARGRPVQGALCSGWFLKGATVRLTSF